jgi:hypothetical protein
VLAARGIRLAVVREPAFRAALDRAPVAERLCSWPDWALYRLRLPPDRSSPAPGCPGGQPPL